MIFLIAGMVIWWGAHLCKRLAPGLHAQLGDKSRGIIAVLVVLSVGLMIYGYRVSELIPVWSPPAFLTHLNNLLMVLAFYLYASSGAKTRITRVIRHPQLTAVKTWAVAHLLVNGDVASIILFGGLLAWAVVSVIAINRAEPVWTKPPIAPARKEVTALVATLIVVGLVMAIHNWLGVQPWS